MVDERERVSSKNNFEGAGMLTEFKYNGETTVWFVRKGFESYNGLIKDAHFNESRADIRKFYDEWNDINIKEMDVERKRKNEEKRLNYCGSNIYSNHNRSDYCKTLRSQSKVIESGS